MQVPAAAVLVRQSLDDLGGLVRREVVEYDVDGQAARDGGVDLLEEPQYVLGGVALLAVRQTSPVATFIAANRSVVPLRL